MENFIKSRNELRNLLINAFKNCYILETIEVYNENIKKGDPGLPEALYNVIEHMILLVKKDLALCLWKIDLDNHKNADSLSKLRKCKEKILKTKDPEIKVIKPKISKNGQETQEIIRKMRNTFLAHTDFERENSRVEVSDMRNLLIEYKNCYNILAEFNGDNSYEVTNDVLNKVKLDMQLGMMFLLKN